MKKTILLAMFLTLGIEAKVIEGKILYSLNEEGVIPVIALDVKGKEAYFTYSGKPTPKYINKRKGQYLRAYLDRSGGNATKVEFIKK